MTNSFLSTENKALVWNLLQEANAFINIPDTYFNRVTELYENIIKEINELSNKSLQERNKLVIVKMMNQLPFLKRFSTQKPLEEVKVTVDKNFKDKQEEFMQLVKHDIPKKVDFNEGTDIPLDSTELNTRLNELMANRNHDLPPPPTPPTTTPPSTPPSTPASAPESAPASAPESAPESAPVSAPVSAPASAPASAPESAPVSAPVSAPASAPASVPLTKYTPDNLPSYDEPTNENKRYASHSGECSDYIWSQFADTSNKKVSFSSDRLLSKLKRIDITDSTEQLGSTSSNNLTKTIEMNQRITIANQDKMMEILNQILVKLSTN